jgi:hypothetical protein
MKITQMHGTATVRGKEVEFQVDDNYEVEGRRGMLVIYGLGADGMKILEELVGEGETPVQAKSSKKAEAKPDKATKVEAKEEPKHEPVNVEDKPPTIAVAPVTRIHVVDKTTEKKDSIDDDMDEEETVDDTAEFAQQLASLNSWTDVAKVLVDRVGAKNLDLMQAEAVKLKPLVAKFGKWSDDDLKKRIARGFEMLG